MIMVIGETKMSESKGHRSGDVVNGYLLTDAGRWVPYARPAGMVAWKKIAHGVAVLFGILMVISFGISFNESYEAHISRMVGYRLDAIQHEASSDAWLGMAFIMALVTVVCGIAAVVLAGQVRQSARDTARLAA